MPCTKLRFDLMLAKADSGKQSPYSPQKKARQGVRGGYPEGGTSAAVVRRSRFSVGLGSPRRGLVFDHFSLFFFPRVAQQECVLLSVYII